MGWGVGRLSLFFFFLTQPCEFPELGFCRSLKHQQEAVDKEYYTVFFGLFYDSCFHYVKKSPVYL